MNIILIIGVTLVVVFAGGGLAYLLWILTRPKKMVWRAKIYEIGQGSIKKDSGYSVKDLHPVGVDILEKITPDFGMVVYRLQRLNKTTPAVTSDCVENWGGKLKEVKVLLENDSCTLLKSGYDEKGTEIFEPIPYETMNMIQHESAIKKHRIQNEKDILQAITPWVVTGISIIGLIFISYILANCFLELNKGLKSVSELAGEKQAESAQIFREAIAELAKKTEDFNTLHYNQQKELAEIYRIGLVEYGKNLNSCDCDE